MEIQLSGPAAHKKTRIEGLLDTRPKGKAPIGLILKRLWHGTNTTMSVAMCQNCRSRLVDFVMTSRSQPFSG
jgi:hypothetical protein